MVLLLLFLLVFIFSTIELKYPAAYNIKIFNLLYLLLTIIVVFRFGVGADYPTYYQYFEEISDSNITSVIYLLGTNSHGEPLYLFVVWIFSKIGLTFRELAIFFAFVSMSLYYKFFKEICNYSIISLFVFLAIYYVVYPFNVIRQGLTIALFLGILLPLLLKGDIKKYVLLTLLFSLFHYSLMIILILPLITKLNIYIPTFIFCLVIVICFFIPIGKLIIGSLNWMSSIFSYLDSEVNYLAVVNRCIFAIPAFLLYKRSSKDSIEYKISYIYIIGFLIFIVFKDFDLIASRLTAYFKVLEIYIISVVLRKMKIEIFSRYILFGLCSMLLFFLYVKAINTDINYLIQTGNYSYSASIMNYRIRNPYFIPN